jgi:hypothetical protein
MVCKVLAQDHGLHCDWSASWFGPGSWLTQLLVRDHLSRWLAQNHGYTIVGPGSQLTSCRERGHGGVMVYAVPGLPDVRAAICCIRYGMRWLRARRYR